nr:hypothetical protein [Streptomyces sp. FT05W]
MAKKAKNFKKSKTGAYVSMGTTAFGALSRRARAVRRGEGLTRTPGR